jgi:hypothetical protein
MVKVEQKLKERHETSAQTDLEFVSPLQPEECVQLLMQRHDWGLIAALTQRIRVDISQLDYNTYEFKIERVSGRGAVAQVMGDLRRWEGTSTRVIAESRMSDDMHLTLFVLCFLIIGIPIAILNYYRAQRARRELIRIIQTSLSI